MFGHPSPGGGYENSPFGFGVNSDRGFVGGPGGGTYNNGGGLFGGPDNTPPGMTRYLPYANNNSSGQFTLFGATIKSRGFVGGPDAKSDYPVNSNVRESAAPPYEEEYRAACPQLYGEGIGDSDDDI